MAMEQPESAGASSRDTAATCYWHPEAETGLSCSRCGKNICTNCLVQAPVGLRCRECGKAQPMPTYDVRPPHYLKAIAAALLLAVGGVVLWVILDRMLLSLGGLGSVSAMLAAPFGYGVGEAISRVLNRKRDALLAMIAAGVVLVAFLVKQFFSPYPFGIWDIFFVAAGCYLAWQRLRR